jgi:hypothetical protein
MRPKLSHPEQVAYRRFFPASWRTFSVGDEIKIAGDDEKVKWKAVGVSVPLSVSEFVKDMILHPTCQSDHCRRMRSAKRETIFSVMCLGFDCLMV